MSGCCRGLPAKVCIARPYGCSDGPHGDAVVIEHKMPTNAERRAEIDRKIAAGEPLGASHVSIIKGGVFVNGSLNGGVEYSKIAPSSAPRWPCRGAKPVRKSHNRNGSACHGKDVPCLPGLNGKCVACFDDD